MKPNGSNWRHGRARLDLSAEAAAERLRISAQYLRNIESNQERATPSQRLVYRAAALYKCTFADLVVEVDGDEQPADKPAEEPDRQEREPDPSGPRRRSNGDRDRKGPPRSAEMRAAS